MRDYAKHEQSIPQTLKSFLTALLALAVAISFSGFSAQLAYGEDEVSQENATYTIIRYIDGDEQAPVYGGAAEDSEGNVEVNKALFDVPAGYEIDSITLVGDPDQNLTLEDPITVPKGSTVLVKIVKNENNKHELSYTIKYMSDGAEVATLTTVTENVSADTTTLAYDPSKVVVPEGYKLENVTLNGKPVEANDPISDGAELIANLVKDGPTEHELSYTIKYMSGDVEVATPTTVTENVSADTTTLAYDPSKVVVPEGYKLENVTLDGNPVKENEQISNGATLVANLVKDDPKEHELSYTITYKLDGVLQEEETPVTSKVPEGTTTLPFDQTKVKTFVGYVLQDVTLDGAPVQANTPIPNKAVLIANYVKENSGTDTPKLEGKWRRDSVGWWYEYTNTHYPTNEWCLIDGEYYHFNGSGYMQIGWIKNGYGIQNNKLEDNLWFYLDKSGAMQTGWVKVNSSWYYLLPIDDQGIEMAGTMVASTLKTIKDGSVDKVYCFKSSGAMVTGWHKTGDNWLYFGADGAQQYNKWIKSGGSWFWLTPQNDGDGVMAKSAWVGDDRDYYVGADGAMYTGWKRIGKNAAGVSTVDTNGENSWYYFSSTGKVRKSAWIKSGGSWYWMRNDGAMTCKDFTPDDMYYLGANGVMQTGWVKVDSTWYHFDDSGLKTTKKWVKSAGKWYYLKDNGTMETSNWVNSKYYVDDSGAMVTGWKRIPTNSDYKPTTIHDGWAWYYFDESGAKAVEEWVQKDGKWYWFGDDGAMVEGEWVDGGKYYVNAEGVYDPNAKKPAEDKE